MSAQGREQRPGEGEMGKGEGSSRAGLFKTSEAWGKEGERGAYGFQHWERGRWRGRLKERDDRRARPVSG